MRTVRNIAELRAAVEHWRRNGGKVALVPTMGNLHAGHLRLVERAGRAADHVVVSIFVNPLQFGKNEDFAEYPRTLKQDSITLAESGVHLLFTPEVEEMYPHGVDHAARVEVPGLSDILCGAVRPGHFAGVATVVAKLLNAVLPDVAVFGEKDYQQLLVIRTMVEDLCMPVAVIGVPTVREEDGFALSSRNNYLSAEERRRAPILYQTLCQARDRLLGGARDYGAIAAACEAGLREAGFRPDYVSVRRANDLAPPEALDSELVILAAAWLGKARLIDNVPVSLKDTP